MDNHSFVMYLYLKLYGLEVLPSPSMMLTVDCKFDMKYVQNNYKYKYYNHKIYFSYHKSFYRN